MTHADAVVAASQDSFPAQAPGAVAVCPLKKWFEVSLENESGEPYASEAIAGSTTERCYETTLDSSGRFYEPGVAPGICEANFPKFSRTIKEWTPPASELYDGEAP